MFKKILEALNPSDFNEFKEDVDRRNYESMHLLAVLGIPISILNILAQNLIVGNHSDIVSYMMLFYFTCLYLVCRFMIRSGSKHITMIMYLSEIPPLVMTLLMGTVLDPSHQALTFLLFLMAMPLFILDKPWRLLLTFTGWAAAFMVMVLLFKEEKTWRPDFIHMLEFYMVSAAVTMIVLLSRIDAVRTYLQMLHVFEKDELTGLASRDHFYTQAAAILDVLSDKSRQCSIAHLDIRNMMAFNEKYGRPEGDKLLGAVARALENRFAGRVSSRISDDHFVVLAYREEMESALRLVNADVNDYLRNIELAYGERNPQERSNAENRLRIGLYQIKPGDKISQACDRAKSAADSINEATGFIVKEYNPQLEAQLHDEQYIVEHIDEAVEKEHIIVYYQPIIRTLTGELCGYEALSRWIDPQLGFMPPDKYISALEKARQIHKIDTYVINRICHDIRVYQNNGIEVVPVSFNLSRLDFQLCDVFRIIEQAVTLNGIDRSLINIEITESIIAEGGYIREVIEKLHGAGYQVWMDDFGSGYSSLNSLKDYEFDKLKIDMLFLSSFTQRSRDIISSVVHMAKKIGIRTLAEGCETQEQYEFLRSIGCEEVQGFYFGKPMTGDESRKHIEEQGIGIENPGDAQLYKTAGHTEYVDNVPTAIFDFADNQNSTLFANTRFIGVLRSVGLDMQTALQTVNEEDGIYYRRFRERLQECSEKKKTDRFYFSYGGTYLAVALSVIAENSRHLICKLELVNTHVDLLKHFPGVEEEDGQEQMQTILVADDEPVNCMLLGEMLKGRYNILYAEDGQKALAHINARKEEISCVILDMVMPNVDGMEVLRTIRSNPETKHIPVIAMTSATDLEVELLDAGVNQFIPKPLESPKIVLAKVRNVIRNANLLKESSAKE